MNITYYHDGTGLVPTIGDIVYSDSAGTTPLGSDHIRIGLSQTMEIENAGLGNPNTGEVVALNTCI